LLEDREGEFLFSAQAGLPIEVSPPGKIRCEGALPVQTEVSQADGVESPSLPDCTQGYELMQGGLPLFLKIPP
jgi:hypothetical protein